MQDNLLYRILVEHSIRLVHMCWRQLQTAYTLSQCCKQPGDAARLPDVPLKCHLGIPSRIEQHGGM